MVSPLSWWLIGIFNHHLMHFLPIFSVIICSHFWIQFLKRNACHIYFTPHNHTWVSPEASGSLPSPRCGPHRPPGAGCHGMDVWCPSLGSISVFWEKPWPWTQMLHDGRGSCPSALASASPRPTGGIGVDIFSRMRILTRHRIQAAVRSPSQWHRDCDPCRKRNPSRERDLCAPRSDSGHKCGSCAGPLCQAGSVPPVAVSTLPERPRVALSLSATHSPSWLQGPELQTLLWAWGLLPPHRFLIGPCSTAHTCAPTHAQPFPQECCSLPSSSLSSPHRWASLGACAGVSWPLADSVRFRGTWSLCVCVCRHACMCTHSQVW